MKRILEYSLYQAQRAQIISESAKAIGTSRWPSDWKKMKVWKELEAMGFEDVTNPLQAKNSTIMLLNRDFPQLYPAGLVLQASGYVRDKGVTSGFVRKYEGDFTLEEMLNYVKERWSKEAVRMNPGNKGTLTQEQIRFIGLCTKSPWRWNSSTNSVDVDGNVSILGDIDRSQLGTFKFGNVKGDFNLYVKDEFLDTIEDFAPSSVKEISVYTGRDGSGGIKSTKGFPQKIKGGANIFCDTLESLEDVPLDIKFLRTNFFDVEPFNVDNALTILNKGSVKTYTYPGGRKEIKPNEDKKPGQDDRARDLVTTILTDENLDSYFKKNPLSLHYLDQHPDIKAGVLKRTGMRDLSNLGKNLDTGWI